MPEGEHSILDLLPTLSSFPLLGLYGTLVFAAFHTRNA